MKKLLILALASSAVLATPAAAADFGQDAIGWYNLDADVDSFCLFGTNNTAGATNNASITSTNGEADGDIVFDIQDNDDNTVQNATATYRINNAVCNEAFTVTAKSQNGGLKSPTTVVDTDFINLVPYTAQFLFDGNDGTPQNVVAGTDVELLNSPHAQAGLARLRLKVNNSNDLLLEGAYDDFLIVSMLPSVGGGS
jgi:hypothetical protein